jgi:hypothetical protein
MPRSKYFIGVALIVVSAVAILITGWVSSDAGKTPDTRVMLNEPTVGSDGLSEVVVTARRPRPGSVALSDSEAVAAASTPASRLHHR